MQSSDKSDSAKIVFDVKPARCIKQLVNNEYRADILFKVGQCGQLIYGHKLILTMASEVFFAQFNGNFSESERDTLSDPVRIEDIEPAPFLQLLRYMYCKKIDITPENLLDVLYASKKYILRKLEFVCLENFNQLITETTVMSIFQQNHRYGNPEVDQICLKVICKNPLKCFMQDAFLALDKQALEQIAFSPAMNCRIDHLDEAINRWKQSDESRKNSNFEVKLKGLLCQKNYIHDTAAYSLNIDTLLVINSETDIEMYGIGIFVGVAKNTPPVSNSTVTIKVDINGLTVEEKVPVTDDLKVHEIMFEKQLIKTDCPVSVKIVKEDCLENYKMFHLKGVSMADNSKFTITISQRSNRHRTNHYMYSSYNYVDRVQKINCVAYFMTNK